MNKLDGSKLIKISDKRWVSVDSITSKRFYRGRGRPRHQDYTVEMSPILRTRLRNFVKSKASKKPVVRKVSKPVSIDAVIMVMSLLFCAFLGAYKYLKGNNTPVVDNKAHAEVAVQKSEHELYLEKKEKNIREALEKYTKYFEDDTTDRKNAEMIADKFYDTGEYELALCVAANESGFRSDALNVNDNGSRDLGLWMINDVHELPDEFRYDPVKSNDWAYSQFIIKRSFTTPTVWYGASACSDIQ